MSQTPPTAPTIQQERIEALDVIRGFALIGILLINIFSFANPGIPPFLLAGRPLADQIVMLGLLIFVESKFFTVFSFLFGMGFALQFLKSESRNGADFVPFFRRRLFFLGLFGVAHIVFFWEGDILLLYALVGLIMIAFRNLPPRRLLQWVLGLLLVPTLIYTLLLVGLLIARTVPEAAASIAEIEAEIPRVFAEAEAVATANYSQSDYVAILIKRVQAYSETGALLITRIPTVLAMFLLGLYVGKTELLVRLEEQQTLWKWLRRWGLVLGLGMATVIGLASFTLPILLVFVMAFFNQALAGPLTAIGFTAALALLIHHAPRWSGFRWLASYGRMALTNYMLQSVICTTIFYGYGFGLVGQLSLPTTTILAFLINGLLIAFSVLWLRVFRMGPLEWLWRSLNYQQLQPIYLATAKR